MRINGVTISGGNFSGVSIGGSANTSGMQETRAGGARVQFGPLRGGSRQVVINGSISIGVSAGSSTQSTINGFLVRSDGENVWVNGEKVAFDGKTLSPQEIEAEQARATVALKARYPGVVFEPGFDASGIEPSVTIAPGAVVTGTPELRGSTKVGPEAVVSGGVANNSIVNGTLSGGVLNNSTLDEGGSVSGGVLNGASVASGASVSGGVLNGTRVGEGRKISGGVHNG